MNEPRDYVGPQEDCGPMQPMQAAQHNPNHGNLGGLAGSGKLAKSGGVGIMIDVLMTEAEQLLQAAAQLTDELSPVLLCPTPEPQPGATSAPDNPKCAQSERIEQEIWKVRRVKLMLIDLRHRLDV